MADQPAAAGVYRPQRNALHSHGGAVVSVHPIIGKFEGLIYCTNGNRKINQ
jgi:hypothetical protein